VYLSSVVYTQHMGEHMSYTITCERDLGLVWNAAAARHYSVTLVTWVVRAAGATMYATSTEHAARTWIAAQYT
jgi:hypothetical protein